MRKAAAIAGRLDLATPALVKAFEKAKGGIGNGRIDFEVLEKVNDYQISFLQFEKGEVIHHHDHPGMTGVLLCATGDIDVWNYEEMNYGPGGAKLLLKQTFLARLIKSDVSTLTSKARNIHQLKARELTQLVDIFAPPYNRERIHASRWFDVDDERYEGREGTFEAKVR